MSVYKYADYRQAIKKIVEEKKKRNPSLTLSELAKATRVQTAYVSKVLNGSADFNADQLYLICQFLELTPPETRYMLLLLEHARSQLQERKKQLKNEISAIQDQYRQTKSHINPEDAWVRQQARQEYFLDPFLQLIYAALTIPRYQKDIGGLAGTAGIPPEKIEAGLKKLQSFGMIEKDKAGWKVTQTHFHIPKEDPLCRPYQTLLKIKSMEQIMKLPEDRSYNFVWTISMDDKTRTAIQDEFLAFLKKVNPLVLEAPSEKLYQLNFEMFPWES